MYYLWQFAWPMLVYVNTRILITCDLFVSCPRSYNKNWLRTYRAMLIAQGSIRFHNYHYGSRIEYLNHSIN